MVLIVMLVQHGGGRDNEESAQVSGPTNMGATAPSPPPMESVSPTAATNSESPSTLFLPVELLSPVQAPVTFPPAGQSGLILNQFGEVFGYNPDGQVTSLSSAVSGDGNTVALMSRTVPGSLNIKVTVYCFSGEWKKLGKDIMGDGDISINGSGQALALSQKGNTLVIGFFNVNCDLGKNCGRVQVYSFKDGAWSQLGSDLVGEMPNAFLGLSVAISNNGKTIATGAPYDNGADGTIHLGKVKFFNMMALSGNQ